MFAADLPRNGSSKTKSAAKAGSITPKGRCFEFPLKEQHVYLGVTVSYHSAAKHTVAYRTQAANQTWQRLRQILSALGPSLIDVHKRLAIWRATV